MGVGQTTITGTTGGISGTAVLTVTRAPAVLSRLTLTLPTTLVSGVATRANLVGFSQYNDTMPVPSVTWTSAQPTIATVSPDGTVTGALVGAATIRATAGTLSATSPVTVVHGAPAALALSRPGVGPTNRGGFITAPQIEIRDAAGNRATSDNSTVVLMTVTGAVATGTRTVIASAGVATFAAVVFNGTAGAQVQFGYSAAGLTPASQLLNLAPYSFGNGTRLVGAEIPPGLYRSLNAAGSSCYWARLRNTTGVGDIIANDIGPGQRLVEIVQGDVAFQSSGCASWTEAFSSPRPDRNAPFADGVYFVGVDIDPGTWRAVGPGSSCYWSRLRNVRGADDIIANFFGDTPAVMTVSLFDFAVSVSRCGNWVKVP